MNKRVIVEIDGGDGTLKILLVEPTGHMRFTFDMLHPEKQWLMEAIDQRDGTVSFFALADIRHGSSPTSRAASWLAFPWQKSSAWPPEPRRPSITLLQPTVSGNGRHRAQDGRRGSTGTWGAGSLEIAPGGLPAACV
jgi:hypothetical protein